MIDRRRLLAMAASAPAIAAFPQLASAALPNLSGLRTRNIASSAIEVIYKTPHTKPNGLDVTSEGMWIMDQGPENYASLINPQNGALIREYVCEGVRSASGIAIDGDTAWVGSTYNRLIVAVDERTGKLKGKYSTPGAGQIYKVVSDVPGRRTNLKPAYPEPPKPPPPVAGTLTSGGRRGAGLQDDSVQAGPVGTGAHCILVKGNLLYVAVPPARMIFVIEKNTWVVQNLIQTAGSRPHDMTWTNDAKTHFWASDSDLNAFFLHDATTGQMTERLQLPSDSPVIHGAKLWNGHMYNCDDAGWMFRFRMPA
ncbi:MAG: hypothetical protein RL274_998 [Pseudomonadota bacterium]|jgi:hypothetical protein